jgi:hypothetical protein
MQACPACVKEPAPTGGSSPPGAYLETKVQDFCAKLRISFAWRYAFSFLVSLLAHEKGIPVKSGLGYLFFWKESLTVNQKLRAHGAFPRACVLLPPWRGPDSGIQAGARSAPVRGLVDVCARGLLHAGVRCRTFDCLRLRLGDPRRKWYIKLHHFI